MNWKSDALRRLGWKTALLGGVAGLCGGVSYDLLQAYLVPFASVEALTSDTPSLLIQSAGTLGPLVVLGLMLGGMLAPVDDLLYRHFKRARITALRGALLTGLAALVLASVVWGLQGFTPAPGTPVASVASGGPSGVLLGGAWMDRSLAEWSWGLLPAVVLGFAGGVSGLVSRRKGAHPGRRGLAGLILGTLLGAGAVVGWQVFPAGGWTRPIAVSLWAMVMALLLFWREKATAKRWLRLLTAPGEDRIFPLAGSQLTLGNSEVNDIPLKNFHEVYPYHCQVAWVENHYEIVDNEKGGVVMVNFRQITQQTLKSGDLVKIGSAVLQYGEVR